MPRESCPACGSFEWTWERSSGKGRVFSWTVVHRALHPGFTEDLPYAVVIIELDEGVRLVSHVVELAPDALQLDLPVEVVFDDVTPESRCRNSVLCLAALPPSPLRTKQLANAGQSECPCVRGAVRRGPGPW